VDKRLYLVVLICILFFGCKKHKEKNTELLNITIEYKSNTKGTLFLILNKIALQDSSHASFVIKQPLDYNKNFITKTFKSPFFTKLPDYIQLRLSTHLEALKINKIVFQYKKNELIIYGKDIERYFTFTPNIIFDKKSNALKTKDIKSVSPAIIRLDPNYIRFLERK